MAYTQIVSNVIGPFPGEGSVNITDMGCKGDDVTNNSVALQAAIDYAQANNVALYVPKGVFRATGLTITGPVRIYGDDPNTSIIRQIAGYATPVFSITRGTGITYWHNFVQFDSFQIKGMKDDAIGEDVAHGLKLNTGAEEMVVRLNNMYFAWAAGDNLSGATFNGWVEAHNCVFFDANRRNVYANACYDWRFLGCDFSVAGEDNVQLSGCGSFVFLGSNIYSATRYGLNIFNDTNSTGIGHALIGGSIDRNKQHGLVFDCRNGNTHMVIGTRIASNSQLTQNTYSGVWMRTNATGQLSLSNVVFDRTYAVANPNGEEYNIKWEGGSAKVLVSNPMSRGRSNIIGSASFASAPANVIIAGDLSTGISLTSAGGLSLNGAVSASLTNYADDAAAATGGVAVGQLYRTASAVKVRVS
jgi:hypothetical protein